MTLDGTKLLHGGMGGKILKVSWSLVVSEIEDVWIDQSFSES